MNNAIALFYHFDNFLVAASSLESGQFRLAILWY